MKPDLWYHAAMDAGINFDDERHAHDLVPIVVKACMGDPETIKTVLEVNEAEDILLENIITNAAELVSSKNLEKASFYAVLGMTQFIEATRELMLQAVEEVVYDLLELGRTYRDDLGYDMHVDSQIDEMREAG